uniref:PAS domain-containing protein n=1 Tax=Haptolina brevifila TaxID=156173 RepID=A0A7S2MUG9_9EUKA|mmetsp:Transcript_58990/g.117200  ORF Transcript_58990/g.117200 Transcript_58990/m.117200 type:complete len:281 (+) Transcript_58990:93-935(+)|eukprot:CAMPEP_0174735832 /NCGR_PEP_ID=MMETSP1094-20130205/65619_1 /TAXON_ID=156173 /ORGANISM="Chrysochromulina brevifilum, Strain UTEX LB 985" /LENGTH=280 /DNA_ID=CAMNT_0015938843 /DNA_START=86 /DNA_END=928 /DNA_ORIENTATION=-
MPGGFSAGAYKDNRPSPRLFCVPTLPEKQPEDKQPEEIPGVDLDNLSEWIDYMLEGGSPEDEDMQGALGCEPPKPPPKAPIPAPPATLLLSVMDEAKAWSKSGPLEGFRPPCILSGPGAPMNTGKPSGPASTSSAAPPAPAGLLASEAESVFELRTADAVLVSMQTSTAFGYSPAELCGQALLSITHPDAHSEMLHALQVLHRMDEIMRATGAVDVPPTKIRLIHQVIVGLNRDLHHSQMVTVDSRVTLCPPIPGACSAIFRSRKAQGEHLTTRFAMLPA